MSGIKISGTFYMEGPVIESRRARYFPHSVQPNLLYLQ